MAKTITIEEAEGLIGQELGVSEWTLIDQERINKFADVTADWQFIHIDPERAKAETPFGSTIAHGYLTLSLLAGFAYQAVPGFEGAKMGVNYGLNKVRFLLPVRVNSRVRGRFALKSIEKKSETSIMAIYDVTVEIEGEDKPALVAEWVTMVFI
ncbi:MAG: MaoC family dehydratase [Sphingomonadales bacterium]|jgi:acyl dehydratase